MFISLKNKKEIEEYYKMLAEVKKEKYCFIEFSVDEIMSMVENRAVIQKLALVVLTKTVEESVNSKEEGAILRKMVQLHEDILEGFDGIKTKKDAKEKMREQQKNDGY